MKIRQATWKIKTLIAKKNAINPKPQYQRTSVWSLDKKRLLIDSILRGYDLPKFYLRTTPEDPHYEYEVTDGQQRIRAIWEFINQDQGYSLSEALIDNINTKGLKFIQLEQLKKKLEDYELTLAIIEEASPEEIRSLFARLQMGERLNQVELRHALASNIGAAIQSTVDNHPFFKESRISNSRYKHQDYLDHVITLAYYNGETDIKAANIRKMYVELANSPRDTYAQTIKNSNIVLNKMHEINLLSKGIFKNKWAFVDIFWLFYNNLEHLPKVDNQGFVTKFQSFERDRLANNKDPKKLIEKKNSQIHDKNLYEYIISFNFSGNEALNIKVRNKIFTRVFNPSKGK